MQPVRRRHHRRHVINHANPVNESSHLHVDSIDWSTWQPTEYANLCFVVRDGNILLIHKKRGLGAGKINGPGGRIEPNETPLQSAIRELQEEIGVTPTGLEHIGILRFQFLDGYRLHVTVFHATDCTGKLIETDEAVPFWQPISHIPYSKMWQDDPYWLPLLIAKQKFTGNFVFDHEQLLNHHITLSLTN